MCEREMISWLFHNGGSVIRYRVATELMENPEGKEREKLEKDLLNSGLVKVWLNRLVPGVLHHSKNTAFENAVGKLCELGLKAGMRPFDKRMKSLRDKLTGSYGPFEIFYKCLLAGGFARAGYTDEVLTDFLKGRLDAIYRCAKLGSHDIYLSDEGKAIIPKSIRHKDFIKPEYWPTSVKTPLPVIHDIYALAYFPPSMLGKNARRKINSIVEYILHPDYQAFPHGYGDLFDEGSRRHWAMGWNVNLPGYDGFDLDKFDTGYLVQRVELMSHFAVARKHRWFKECLQHLEQYKTEEGRWCFPREYLKEKPSGYYVSGAYMGLEENRRSSKSIELESTFRMLRIKGKRIV